MMHFIAPILADAAATQAAANPFQQFLPLLLMMVAAYMLLIRPGQKARKDLMARMEKMQKGDHVVTTAGLHGMVHHIKDRTVMLKVSEGVFIEFDKTAIASLSAKDSSATA